MNALQGILHEASHPLIFILLSLIFGGAAAWQTGRAVAKGWKPPLQMLFYALLLACVIRFLHFALFEEKLFSLHYYLVDFITIIIGCCIGWRMERAKQMSTQYEWLYETKGWLRWGLKS